MGKKWEERYSGKCVGELHVDADDLTKVVEYMNRKFGKGVSSGATISKRITLYTPGVVHENSKYNSIQGTTTNEPITIFL